VPDLQRRPFQIERQEANKMKRLASLLLLPAVVAVVPLPAHAGSSTDAALGLGAFAVFNQIVRGETVFHGGRPPVRERVVYVPAPPPVVYTPPPVHYAPPPVAYVPPPPVVYGPAPVVYPNGHWYPRGGRWVWVARHKGHHHHGHHHGHYRR
jgi:hypothetical protein